MLKLCRLVGSGAIITLILVKSALADAVVNVSLIDKIGELDLSKSMGLGMGLHGDMGKAGMGINISPDVVPRGKVTFNVTNLASKFVHEAIIARVAREDVALPYDTTKNTVDEETIQTLGQVAEIESYGTASLALELNPGKYILYCNLPGHYMAGMWTVIEVK